MTPVESNADLCARNGITIHQVGEVYETDRLGRTIPETDREKWFVATPAGAYPTELIEAIPLSASAQEAEALAVRRLGLRDPQGIVSLTSNTAPVEVNPGSCPECGASVVVTYHGEASVTAFFVATGVAVALLGGIWAISHQLGLSGPWDAIALVVVFMFACWWVLSRLKGSTTVGGFYCSTCSYSE